MSAVPNASLPTRTTAGTTLALHRLSTGELWVVRQHPDGQWVTVRPATVFDEEAFVEAGTSIRL